MANAEPLPLTEQPASGFVRRTAEALLRDTANARDALVRALRRHDARPSVRRALRVERTVHAYRVAERKLRTWVELVSAFGEVRALRDALAPWRSIARRAGLVRDFQIVRAWYARARGTAARTVAATLARDADEANAALRRAAGRARKAEARGRAALRRVQRSIPPESAAAFLSRALLERRLVASDALARWHASGDLRQAHGARLALKRLRYLLEAVAGRGRGASTTIARLRRAQAVLGAMHDAAACAAAAPLDTDDASTALRQRADRALSRHIRTADSLRDGSELAPAFAAVERLAGRLAR